MNRFSLFLIVVFTVTECCLAGFMISKMRDDPAMKQVNNIVCNNITRPTNAQMMAYMNCHKRPPPNGKGSPPPNGEGPPPNHEGPHQNHFDDDFKECCSAARVKSLTTTDTTDEEMKALSMTCDQVCGDCLDNKLKDHKMNAEGNKISADRKAKLENKKNETIVCMKKAFGI